MTNYITILVTDSLYAHATSGATDWHLWIIWMIRIGTMLAWGPFLFSLFAFATKHFRIWTVVGLCSRVGTVCSTPPTFDMSRPTSRNVTAVKRELLKQGETPLEYLRWIFVCRVWRKLLTTQSCIQKGPLKERDSTKPDTKVNCDTCKYFSYRPRCTILPRHSTKENVWDL